MIPDEKIEKIYDEFNGTKRKQYGIEKKTQKGKKINDDFWKKLIKRNKK